MVRGGATMLRILTLAAASAVLAAACGAGPSGEGPVEGEQGDVIIDCDATYEAYLSNARIEDPTLAAVAEEFEQARSEDPDGLLSMLATDAVLADDDHRTEGRDEIRDAIGSSEPGTSRRAVVVEAADGKVTWISREDPFCFFDRWEATVVGGQIAVLRRVAPTFSTGALDVALDCPDGHRQPIGQAHYFQPPSSHEPAADLVSAFFSGLEDGDVVEEVPGSEDGSPRVRVVREGRTVLAAYMGRAVDLGLYIQLWESCRGFEVSGEGMRLLAMHGEPEPSGFGDPTPIWYDADGRPLARDVVNAYQGPEHCDWQSAIFLELGWPIGTPGVGDDSRLYLRDPKGVVPAGTWDESGELADHGVRFASDVELPSDAVDTGIHNDEYRIFVSEPTADTEIYVLTADGLERWVRGGILCA
jgi:hypothetical protein